MRAPSKLRVVEDAPPPKPVRPGPDIYAKIRADIKARDWGKVHIAADQRRGWRYI